VFTAFADTANYLYEKFGRILPKNKIYEHASPGSPMLKALFVEQGEQIFWQYKLATETIKPARQTGCA
jgi:hypothetical protein